MRREILEQKVWVWVMEVGCDWWWWRVSPGVRPRVVVGSAPLFDGEQLRAVGAVQFLEPVHGHARGARHELQQTGSHLVGERQHHLQIQSLR